MGNFILRQFNLLILTLFILSLFSFFLAYLFPGDPLTNLTGIASSEHAHYQRLNDAFHMQGNVLQQYLHYLGALFKGDWGVSFSSGLPLLNEISRTIAASIELSTYAFIFSFSLGIPLGFLAGLRHNKSTDHVLLSVSVIGYSIPVFWLALIVILLFSLQLGWFPMSGRISLLFDVPLKTGFILFDILLSDLPDKREAFYDALRHLVLPTLSISIVTTAMVVRITRRSVIEIMNSEFIQAAYARGLTSRQVLQHHGIANALIPILPILAMQFTTLLTNAMIVEIIFSWPGIGNFLIQAIYQRDYPAISAGMLAVSSLVVIFNMSVELIIRLIDPTQSRLERVTI
ncbi:MAG: cationic peptide transport system permease protein [Paraglaciecola sp.]|jgi:cationic peptide transport system permease protein